MRVYQLPAPKFMPDTCTVPSVSALIVHQLLDEHAFRLNAL